MKLTFSRNGARQKRCPRRTISVARIQTSYVCQEVIVHRPFLKWAGAKTRVSRALHRLMPSGDFRFVEPFVGSGAVFVNSPYQRSLLADVNPDVIALYATLKERGNEFIETCRTVFVDENKAEQRFYELRTEFNLSRDPIRRASLFLYLNRHCFNGLCRYNKSGEFNTPFGRYDQVYFPAKEMADFAEKLSKAELSVADFKTTLATVGRGDVAYCDPPYLPLSESGSGFTAYSGATFSIEDHIELTRLAVEAASRGATVLISNHDTPDARELYEKAIKIEDLLVSRTISCDGENRNKVKEIVAIFGNDEQTPVRDTFVLHA